MESDIRAVERKLRKDSAAHIERLKKIQPAEVKGEAVGRALRSGPRGTDGERA